MTLRDDAAFKAWLDDDPGARWTATKTYDGDAGPGTVRCDGQLAHGGGTHQGSVAGHPVTWEDATPPEQRPARPI